MRAERVKVIRVTKSREYGNQNASTNVEVEFLENGKAGRKDTVRARDIIDFWEDWKAERDRRVEEREAAARRAEEARRKHREEQEAREKLYIKGKELIANALIAKGIPSGAIRMSETSVSIDRIAMITWLDLPEGTL